MSGRRSFAIQADVIVLPCLFGFIRTGITVGGVTARAQKALEIKAMRSTGMHLRLVSN